MRVAVVGATGNAGTAVLKALAETPEISSVIGLARRMPDTRVAPYAGCKWASVDIGAASTESDVAHLLGDAFAGVDTVIHLAWLIQPNSQRELLRRVNVEGTARVAKAAAAAGVQHLVVASSVGAYFPDRAPLRRDESWPVNGIRSSHYSVDKAAQEQVLDDFSAAHPEVTVTRLRPALTFQADAATEIQRYFLGKWVPVQALRYVKPPFLPVPTGFRGLQAVHADDLGRAYAAAVVKRAAGPFNICADDFLDPKSLANIIDHGRFLRLPARLVRTLLFGGHATRLIAADAGWLDMGMSVPMMDNARAKVELEWQPRHSAAYALEQLMHGMIAGRGAASLPLSSREPERSRVAAIGEPVYRGAANSVTPRAAGLSTSMARDLLDLYLADHLAGATAGAKRIERMAAAYIDTPVYAQLSELADEVRVERAFLKRLIHDLGMKQRRYRQVGSWAAERVGRLMPNGRLFSRSPMTPVLETELMRSALIGKLGVWQTLEDNAEQLGLDSRVFVDLADQARHQTNVLSDVHEYFRARAFREDGEIFHPQSLSH